MITPASLSSSSEGKWAKTLAGSTKSREIGSTPAASRSFNTRYAWRKDLVNKNALSRTINTTDLPNGPISHSPIGKVTPNSAKKNWHTHNEGHKQSMPLVI